MEETLKPDAVEEAPETTEAPDTEEPPVTQPTKLIRIASMTRAMLDEVRQAPLDEAGRYVAGFGKFEGLDAAGVWIGTEAGLGFFDLAAEAFVAIPELDGRIIEAMAIILESPQ